jgi:hypothetical protein
MHRSVIHRDTAHTICIFIYIYIYISRDTTGRGMGRGRGMATIAQGALPELDGLPDDTRGRLEPSVLHVHPPVRMHRGDDRELRRQRLDDRAAEHQPNDRTERADVDQDGGQADVVDRRTGGVVPPLQSHGPARWPDTLLSQHDGVVVHRSGSGAVSWIRGRGDIIHHTRRGGHDTERHLPLGVHKRRCVGGDIRFDRGLHRRHMHELVAFVQQARERVGRGGEVSAHEGEVSSSFVLASRGPYTDRLFVMISTYINTAESIFLCDPRRK